MDKSRNMNNMLENLKKYLDSEEGKKSFERVVQEDLNKEKIKNYQLDKFHNKFNDIKLFNKFVEKVINKYQSDKYRDFWYSKGFEPHEELYYFLHSYAEKYGRECTNEEYIEYGNDFTSSLYFINGYYFNRSDGQGSFINIIKK